MILKIYDDIISDQEREAHVWFCGTDGVTFGDIDDFVNAIPADDANIDLQIHCLGGSVSEGWAIVDKLRATGKTISATIDGTCASMAVSILLAASVRRAHPHATIHIHKPFFPEFTLAGAYNEDDLRRLTNDLENETAKMLDWYVERTGADRAELEALMTADKDINMDEALRLGFIHSIVEPMSASARRKNWDKHLSKNDMANTNKAGVINALANLLGVKVNVVEENAVDYVVTTADGSELTIEKPEGEELAVGDVASPDGEFVLEDGRVVVVADGVIAEIREAQPEENEGEGAEDACKKKEDDAQNEGESEGENVDVEAVKAENDALKAENDELKAKVAELEAKLAESEEEKPSEEDKAIVEKVNKCGGASWLEKVAHSNYSPSQRQAKSDAPKLSKTEQRLAEYRTRK